MKPKHLESLLQRVKDFEKPVLKWEQYSTTPHLASHILFNIDQVFNEIKDMKILDLGVGCGMLSIGCMLLGSAYNVGVDIDENAIEIAKQNCANFDLEMEIIQCDVNDLDISLFKLEENETKPFDIVIMNPPFGTKSKGIDIVFLTKAISLAKRAVYSLHKTSTRDFIIKKAESLGAEARVIAELNYDIKQSYKFHKKKSVDIKVDFIRFEIKE